MHQRGAASPVHEDDGSEEEGEGLGPPWLCPAQALSPALTCGWAATAGMASVPLRACCP